MATISYLRRTIEFFAVGLAMLGLVSAANAGVPDPRFSSVPTCMSICPAGDRAFSVRVRDVNNSDLPNRTVTINLGSCANAVIALCAECAEPSGYNPVTHVISRITNVNGIAAFQLCGSIYCPSGGVYWAEVAADGIVLANSMFVTTDVDGDLDVDSQDVALVTAASGSGALYMDEDCSRAVDASDAAIVTAHLGHRCPGVVPTAPTSWGAIKSVYR